ncbi:hypothetical protein CU084_15045 [Bacillus velezensis]|nr:hypothetical protein CU084_15045 [Bacillus velezensis]
MIISDIFVTPFLCKSKTPPPMKGTRLNKRNRGSTLFSARPIVSTPAALNSVTGVPVSYYWRFFRRSQLKFKGGKDNDP